MCPFQELKCIPSHSYTPWDGRFLWKILQSWTAGLWWWHHVLRWISVLHYATGQPSTLWNWQNLLFSPSHLLRSKISSPLCNNTVTWTVWFMPAAGQWERTQRNCLLSNLYTWVTQFGCTHKKHSLLDVTPYASLPMTKRFSTPTPSFSLYKPLSALHPDLMSNAMMSLSICDLSIVTMWCCVHWNMDLQKEGLSKCTRQREWERQERRCGVYWRDKTNSFGAQATASGGKLCPFCPNKPHQDSWHEGRGIDISSRYAVCCPRALGKEGRWLNMLLCQNVWSYEA